jgi:putrescine transport system substrate-binding protein
LIKALIFSLFTIVSHAEKIFVACWANYIPKIIIEGFKKETGIDIIVCVYDDISMLEAQLYVGNTGYDVIFPTTPSIYQMIISGILTELDKKDFPDIGKIDPNIIDLIKVHDPENKYCIPYIWGTTGIAYNKKLEETIKDFQFDSWNLILDPKYSDKIGKFFVMNCSQEFLLPFMKFYDIDPYNPQKDDIKNIFDKISHIRKNIKKFNQSPVQSLVEEEIMVAQCWSGEAIKAQQIGLKKGIEIKYFVPKEGTVVWIDAIAIPKGAQNISGAKKFIRYIMRPEISKKIASLTSYTLANESWSSPIDKNLFYTGIIKDPKILRSMNKKFYEFVIKK